MSGLVLHQTTLHPLNKTGCPVVLSTILTVRSVTGPRIMAGTTVYTLVADSIPLIKSSVSAMRVHVPQLPS